MSPAPLSVTQLTEYLQELFADDEVLSDVWIEGEVTESVTSRAGHVFFTISDGDCKLKCVLFRGNAMRQRFLPSAGQSFAAHGQVSIYARDGTYQLYVDLLQPAGIGLGALELELLRQRLAAEGLFEESRKRPLPVQIRTIGVVTSAEGAVWHDIQNVAARRNPFVHLILSPAAVQGDAAPVALRTALQRLIADARSDVIVIGRGGGSSSDLAAFNDEQLLRSVFASPIPVVSAVGHEVDWTLLDLVADLRAPTPSAAAELCASPVRQLLAEHQSSLARLRVARLRFLSDQLLHIGEMREDLFRCGPLVTLPARRDQVRLLAESIERSVTQGMQTRLASATSLRAAMMSVVFQSIRDRSARHESQRGVLDVLNPAATLRRGYAVLTDTATGASITGAVAARPGQTLTAHLRDGRIYTRVESVARGDGTA